MAGTGTAYPADASTGTPSYTANQGRTALSAAISGATSTRPLGGQTGVRPGTPTNTATATSTTWTVQPFAGYRDLATSSTNGGYWFSFLTVSTGAVTAAIGSARQDILWVRQDDSNTGDGSGARQVVVDYTAGTLTPPARAFVIAVINVPASGGGSPTVSWVAPYAVASGGVLPVLTLTQLNAITGDKSYPYAEVFNDGVNNGLYKWNGSGWRSTAAYAEFTNVTGVANNFVATLGLSLYDYVEVADASGWHNPVTNPSRITPTTPGRYQVIVSAMWTANATGLRYYAVGVNGVFSNRRRKVVSSTELAVDSQGATNFPVEVTLNGTTDYIEVQSYQTSGTGLAMDAVIVVRYMGPS